MPFLALLKLIPPRAYFDGVIAVAVLVLFAMVYHRGEEHVEAKDTKVAVAAETKTTVAQTTAEATETQNAVIYKQAVTIPPLGDLGVVCHKAGGSSLPTPVSITGASVRKQFADSGAGSDYDPSGAARTRARLADEQIEYLQRRVHELEAEMNAAP